MEVGELHLERALASLSRSFLFFSLSPDWASVAREAALAAEAFHAAGLCCREAKALRLCAQAERNLGKPRAAGKAMQKLGDLMMKEKKAARRSSNSGSSKSSVGGAAAAAYEEAMQCYGEAICFFRAAGAVDLAVPLLLKVSAKREQEKTDKGFGLCAEAYEEALHLLITKHDLQQADEVYRHYICSLVRSKQLQKALSIVFRRIECLYTLGRLEALHKCILTAVFLFLEMGQTALADRTLSGQELVVKLISGPETLKRCRGERHLLVLLLPLLLLPLLVLLLLMLLLLQALRSSFLGSPEFAAGAAAVDASKVGDNVRLAEALEAPVFRLLLPPVAALAAQRAAAVRCCSGANSSREFNEIGFSGEAIDLLLMSETQALNPTP